MMGIFIGIGLALMFLGMETEIFQGDVAEIISIVGVMSLLWGIFGNFDE
jgi:hypothetical protein